jgi:hypothetical protein
VALPAGAASAFAAGATVVGVTSTNFDGSGSFPATWDLLAVTSPQIDGDGPTAAVAGAAAVEEGAQAAYDATPSEAPATDVTVTVDLAGAAVDPAALPSDTELSTGGTQVALTFFPGGPLTQTVTVDAADDAPPGLDERFVVSVSGQPVTPGGASSVAATIAANDGKEDGVDGTPTPGDGVSDDGTVPARTGTLPAGTHTLWLNQGDALSTTVLPLEAAADAGIVPAVSDAPAVTEGDGVELAFGLSAPGFDGTLDMAYEVDGTPATQQVTFAGDVGTLRVPGENDEAANGPETAPLLLTGATDLSADLSDVVIDGAAAEAAGTVMEDDVNDTKGDLVFAVNAGGPAVTTTDGITFAAPTATDWTFFRSYGPGDRGAAGADFDGDGRSGTGAEADPDDLIYETEYFDSGGNLTFQRTDLAPGDYVLQLHFAEIFLTGTPAQAGARVFDVDVNGGPVEIAGLDIAAEVGPLTALVREIPVTVGQDGVLTVALDATADNGKISALALFEAAPSTDDAVITVAAGPTVTENGDEGTLGLGFDILSTVADGTVTVTYAVDGGAPQQASVTFADGAGLIVVDVPLDDVAGGRRFDFALLSVGEGARLGDEITAVATVDDDDFAPEGGVIEPQSVTAGGAFDFVVPPGAFTDGDSPTLLLTSATLGSGDPLPDGLEFANGAFSGSTDAVGTYVVEVTASDGTNTGTATFQLTVGEPSNQAPTTTAIELDPVLETADPVSVDLLQGAEDLDGDTLSVAGVTATDGAGAPVEVTLAGSQLTIDPAVLADALDAGESETISVAYDVLDGKGGVAAGSLTLEVQGATDLATFFLDGDGDGFGDDAQTLLAATRPDGYAGRGGDADDADPAVYPGAPEINDGLDNDQDGETDEENADPTAGADGASTASDTALVLGFADLLANDADPDIGTGGNQDALTITAVEAVAGGTVALDADARTVTFTPTAGVGEPASFTYSLFDGFGGSATGTVDVTLTEPGGSGGTDEVAVALGGDAAISYSTEGNGQDRTGPSAVSVTGGEPGDVGPTVSVSGNSWKSIGLASDLTIPAGAVLRFDYVAPNKISEIAGIGFETDSLFQNAGGAIFQIGGIQTLGGVDQGARRDLTPGTPTSFEIPLDELAGQSFDRLVLINDQDSGQAGTQGVFSDIRIAVPSDGNTPPVAGDDTVGSVEGGQPLVIAAADLLANDTEIDAGDTLSVTGVGNPSTGTVTLSGGQVTFTPAAGFEGPATFDYTVSDARGGTDTGTVSVAVTGGGGGQTGETTPIDFSAAPIESYDDQDEVPGGGFAVGGGGGAITLTGNVWKKIALPPGVAIQDGAELRLTLTRNGPGEGEIIGIGLETDDDWTTDGDALFQLAGRQNFSAGASREAFAPLAVGQSRDIVIDLSDFAGTSFTDLVLIGDDDGQEAVNHTFSNVAIVQPGGDGGTGGGEPPVITGGTLPDQLVTEDAAFAIQLPVTDADTAEADLTYSYDGLPAFVSADGGALSGTPENDDVGTYTVSVTVGDGESTAQGSFELTVENTNDAPEVAGTLPDRTAPLDAAVSLPLAAGVFVDPDAGDTLTYGATGLPSGLGIDPATGTISGTATEVGVSTVTVTATDGAQEAASTTFELTVSAAPPAEAVTIEGEDFTDLSGGYQVQSAGTASGNALIRVPGGQTSAAAATDLDAAGVAPGTYDIAVRHYDETDGASTLRVLIDRGDGSPELLGAFTLDRADLPGQGTFLQAGNLTEVTVPGVAIGAGATLILEGTADAGEFARVDLVRLTPTDGGGGGTDEAPVFGSPAAFAVAEGAVTVGDVVASDPEEEPVTYAITGGADEDDLTIDASGALAFAAAPDFEAPADADEDNVYEVEVSASDGTRTTTQAITVTVKDVVEGAPLTLAGDLDGDTLANSEDGDIDGDGTPNLDDRAAYDADDAGAPISAGDVTLDFTDLADGATPFEAGFTGVAQTASGAAELDYATNDGAQISDGRLVLSTTNADTKDGERAFTFLAAVDGDFTFEGTFDNPVFGATGGLPTFSQYGLIISLTGTPGASTGTNGDFVKLVAGNPGNGFEISGRGSVQGADVKTGYPADVGPTDFAQVRLTLQADVSAGTLEGRYTLLDASGGTIGEGTVGTVAATGALGAVLDGTSSVQPAFGVTSTDTGGGGSFEVAVEGLSLGAGISQPPVQPTDAQAILAAAEGVDTGGIYGAGDQGAVRLTVLDGVQNVQQSNFGSNSFELENTGDKQVAAVFLDFRDAIYGDSVVDFDGSAGDLVTKPFKIDSGAGTSGAIVGGGNQLVQGDSYFLPGDPPLPNDTGTGIASSGGFRGLLLRFDGSSGGFAPGESVGFAGDMDPNSIAGLEKGGAAGVDPGANWDVGGVSGAELIGSEFTVLFDDGSTATGFLGSDGSQAGSVGEAVEGRSASTVSLTVNGASTTGTYGGAVPEIVVTGDPGTAVRVTMSKGHNPVVNDTAGVAGLVEDRLADAQPQFEVNNAADVQTFDVTIPDSGSVTLPDTAFDYGAPGGGVAIDNFATAPLVVAANAVDGQDNPLGPVDRVYLTNEGGPVTGGGNGGGGSSGEEGYFALVGSGGDARFKIQVEDENGSGGANPGGKWVYETAPDAQGRQSGFQGEGYYRFGSSDSTQIQGVQSNEILEYTIFVPEGETGRYALEMRVARDRAPEPDLQNDLWLNFASVEDPLSSIEDYLVFASSTEPEPTSQGFVKLFGGSNSGNWSDARVFDGAPNNRFIQLDIDDPGLYTIQIAGRSQGYHVDYVELFKGSEPPTGASDSPWIEGDPTSGGGDGPGGGTGSVGDGGGSPNEIVVPIDASADDYEIAGGTGSGDLEIGPNNGKEGTLGLRFDGITVPAGAVIETAYIRFEADRSDDAGADFVIQIEDGEAPAPYSDGDTPDDRDYADAFQWQDVETWASGQTYETPDIAALMTQVIGGDGIEDGALAFRIAGAPGNTGGRSAHSFDGDGDAPELVIVLAADDGL